MASLVDGEVTPELDEEFTRILALAKQKCDGYVALMIHMKTQHAAALEVKRMVDAKVNKWKAAYERLRERLAQFMASQRIKELRPANPALPCAYLQDGKLSVTIDAEKLADSALYEIDHVRVPNKTKIEQITWDLIEAKKLDELPAGVTVTRGEPFVMVR